MEQTGFSLTEEQDELLNRIAGYIVKKRLSPAAILALETSLPFNFVGSQLMVFFQPMVDLFISMKEYNMIMEMLDRRESIEILMNRIEELENKYDPAEVQPALQDNEQRGEDNGKN